MGMKKPAIRATASATAGMAMRAQNMAASGVRRRAGISSGATAMTTQTSSVTSTRSDPSSWLGTVAPISGM